MLALAAAVAAAAPEVLYSQPLSISIGNASIVRVDPTLSVPGQTLVDFWRLGAGPLAAVSWPLGAYTGSAAPAAATRGRQPSLAGSSAISYADGVFGAVLNMQTDPIEPGQNLGTITIEQSWEAAAAASPWASGGVVDLLMHYQVPTAAKTGIAVYTSWTVGISHRVSRTFVWYETALFDLDRPLGGDAIFYDTISHNLIIHGVLGNASAFHTRAADSAAATTAPWSGWRRIHFTISAGQVAAAIAAANAKYDLTLGDDPADWQLVHFNVEVEGTSGGRAAHAIKDMRITALPGGGGSGGGGGQPSCRDPFLWPFNASSIWNTAIGSDAQYVAAGIYPEASGPRGPPVEIHSDQDILVRTSASDPLVDWLDDSGQFPGLCGAKGPVRQQLPLPHDFVTDCVANNNGAAVLLPDGDTLVQMQPLYRAAAGGPFVAWWHTGAPQPFPWNNSIRGEGALGAHGGSGLSAIGGTLRLGELLPGAPPIAHALKLELWAHAYYFYNYSSGEYASCFTWPAVGCDSYYRSTAGDGYNGTHPLVHPGALLAVPPAAAPAVAAGLRTEPARRILQALVDYGGYLVDDTGSQQGGGALCMERGVTAELRAAYNVSVAIEDPLTPAQGGELYADLVAIFRALAVVSNNSPRSIGGGGTPRRPPPPPFC